ncbi:MAG: flagellar assembly protein FliW [Clostridiales bacterium]|nr:flagellar assembly protein FliW [Clostridiales bacterium]MCF8021761.1 flagellar assembly protein FliW [Clostridiales bacterium]
MESQNTVINFPGGIPGFENIHRFILLPVEGTRDIQHLQSLDGPEVSLLVVNPFQFFKEYDINIPDEVIEELEIEKPSEVVLLTTITIPEDNPADTTANLVAPIIINPKLKKGKQVILNGSIYTTKHRLFPENIKEKVSGGEGA